MEPASMKYLKTLYIATLLCALLICVSHGSPPEPEPEPIELLGRMTGPDTSSCTGEASSVTRQHMKMYRQCAMRVLRNQGKLFRNMTDEDFNAKLSTASSDCLIDDICYDEPQARKMLLDCMENDASNGAHHRAKRAFSSDANLWENFPIEYTFVPSCNFNDEAKDLFREVVGYYEGNTCMTFREVGPNETNNGIFFDCQRGCFSSIGNISTATPQRVNIEIGSPTTGTCLTFAIVAHEFLHAFGFYHEQSRLDRDDHVKILIENVRSGLEHNFAKALDATDNGQPYDYTSVMHYSKTAFVVDDPPEQFTIIALGEDRNTSLGQRGEVSFLDLLELNLKYCGDSCADSNFDNACTSGGYANPSSCNRCICPPPFDSPTTFCSSIGGSEDDACLGTQRYIELTPVENRTELQVGLHTLHSFSCGWQITAPRGYTLTVDTVFFSLHARPGYDPYCQYEWLEMYKEEEARTKFIPSPRWCGKMGPVNRSYNTTSLIVLFRSTQFPFGTLSRNGFTLAVYLEEDTVTELTTDAIASTDSMTTDSTIEQTTSTAEAPTSTVVSPAVTTTTVVSPAVTTTTVVSPAVTTTTVVSPAVTTTTVVSPAETTSTSEVTTSIIVETTSVGEQRTTSPTETSDAVQIYCIFRFQVPMDTFATFLEDFINDTFASCNEWCPFFNLACMGVDVVQLNLRNMSNIYVADIGVTINCGGPENALSASDNGAASDVAATNIAAGPAPGDISVQIPPDTVRDVLLENFDNLIRAIDDCCSEGVISACCAVIVSRTITVGPPTGPVEIPPDLTTTPTSNVSFPSTTSTSTTAGTSTESATTRTTPARPGSTGRQSAIAAIWGGVAALTLFVIVVLVLMLMTRGRSRCFRRPAFGRAFKYRVPAPRPGIGQPVYVTVPPVVRPPINPGIVLRRSNNMFQPRFPQLRNTMNPYSATFFEAQRP